VISFSLPNLPVLQDVFEGFTLALKHLTQIAFEEQICSQIQQLKTLNECFELTTFKFVKQNFSSNLNFCKFKPGFQANGFSSNIG
jgi:hypothetical protein